MWGRYSVYKKMFCHFIDNLVFVCMHSICMCHIAGEIVKKAKNTEVSQSHLATTFKDLTRSHDGEIGQIQDNHETHQEAQTKSVT